MERRGNLIVKKDFGNLITGDEIEISTDMDSRVYFSVNNRKSLVRFYGNEKGRWGVGNPVPSPRPKGFVPFMLVEERMQRFTVLEFSRIPSRPPHPTKELYWADGTENWEEQWIDKIVNDFKSIGVF